ncbi:Protein-tyrosine-phosphatase MKP1 [Diplonema papillatum]|nr:Protein-tyrosine-phosphatase MKP1 [Diplonema papillatum]
MTVVDTNRLDAAACEVQRDGFPLEFPPPPCLPGSYGTAMEKWVGAWQPVSDPAQRVSLLHLGGAIGPNCSEILPHLYLGNLECASDLPMLQADGITHVLTLTKRKLPDAVMSNLSCRQLAIDDKPKAQIHEVFAEAFEHIEDAKSTGGAVLVHCRAGVSRGSCCCIAYLMKFLGMPLRDAYAFVKERRPIAHPNKGFVDQLRFYEVELRGGISHATDINHQELPYTLWERAQHLGLNEPIPNMELSLKTEQVVSAAFRQRYQKDNPYLTMDAGLGGKMQLHSVELYWVGDFEWIDAALVDVLFTNRPQCSNYVSKKHRKKDLQQDVQQNAQQAGFSAL